MITTRHVTSIGGLQALGPGYDAMVLAAGAAGLFYQQAWLERVWPYYRARLGGALSFVIAEHGGRPVGLAPLVLRREGWSHARRRVLSFIGGTSDELDNWTPAFLFATARPDEQAAIMAAFLEAIALARQQRARLLELRATTNLVRFASTGGPRGARGARAGRAVRLVQRRIRPRRSRAGEAGPGQGST